MSVLVRKIDLALWSESIEGFEAGEVPAAIIQNKDFAAKDNTLSFWRFDTTEPTWQDDAILAIVGGWSRIDGLNLVHLSEADLKVEVSLIPSTGRTCFAQLQEKHVDAAKLDGRRLAVVAEIVAARARAGTNLISKTREEVVDVLVDAVTRRRMMKPDNLPQALKGDVLKRLQPR